MANIAPDNLYEYINELRQQYEALPQGEVPSYEKQTKYINDPGHVGTVWYNPGDPFNRYGFTPSEVDFSNAKLSGTEALKDAFGNVTGEAALYKTDGGTLVYDPKMGSLNAFRPDAPTSYDPSQIQYNFAGTPYIEPTKTATTYKYNGVDVPITQNDVFAIDPLTGKAYTTPGDYGWTTKVAPSSGGFADWATSNGWMVPLAIAGAGVASGALSAGAGAGAGSMDAYMASAGLTPGAFEGAAFTMPTGLGGTGVIGDQIGDYPMPGESGTASQWTPSNINPADVDKLLEYNASYGNSGLTLKDALSTANQARQVLGAGNSLAKLLSGGAGGKTSGTTSQQQIAQYLNNLSAPQTTNFLGQYKMNQNPFLFETPGQTTAPEGTYDVSGSKYANALRNK